MNQDPITTLAQDINQLGAKIDNLKKYNYNNIVSNSDLEIIVDNNRLVEYDNKINILLTELFKTQYPDLNGIIGLYNNLIERIKPYLKRGSASNSYSIKNITKDLDIKYFGLLLSNILNLHIIFSFCLKYIDIQELYRHIHRGDYTLISSFLTEPYNLLNPILNNKFIDDLFMPNAEDYFYYQIKIDNTSLNLQINKEPTSNIFNIELSDNYNLKFNLIKNDSTTSVPVQTHSDCVQDINVFEDSKSFSKFTFSLRFFLVKINRLDTSQPTRSSVPEILSFRKNIKFSVQYYSCNFAGPSLTSAALSWTGIGGLPTFTRRRFIFENDREDNKTILSFNDNTIDGAILKLKQLI